MMKKKYLKFIFSLMVSIFTVIVGFSQTEDVESNSTDAFGITIKGPKYGLDSVSCVKNLSLYREYFIIYKRDKNEEYLIDAISPWRWVFLNCPLATQNTYIDGVVILEHLINKEKDPIAKDKLIDTLMMVYNQRIAAFGQEGYVRGKQATDLMKYKPNSVQQIFDLYSLSFKLLKNSSESAVLYYYLVSAINLVKSAKADTSLILDIYDKVTAAANFNINTDNKYLKEGMTSAEAIELIGEPKEIIHGDDPNSKDFLYGIDTKVNFYENKVVSWTLSRKDPKIYKKIQNPYTDALGNIESISDEWLKCPDLLRVYGKQFAKSPEDVELLIKITNLLDKKNCTESDLFFKATENLHRLQPTAESAFLMGKLNVKKKNFTKAADYIAEAVKLYEAPSRKADALYLLAQVNLILKNYPAVRANALDGLSIRPADGKFYITIGLAYAQSASSCGDNEISSNAAYWAAIDKFNKAKNIDRRVDVIEDATKHISLYSRYFPETNTIFFHTLKEGEPYTVGCWINEVTTVRARK